MGFKKLGLVALLALAKKSEVKETEKQRRYRLWRDKVVGFAMDTLPQWEFRIWLASLRSGGREGKLALERMNERMVADRERKQRAAIKSILNSMVSR